MVHSLPPVNGSCFKTLTVIIVSLVLFLKCHQRPTEMVYAKQTKITLKKKKKRRRRRRKKANSSNNKHKSTEISVRNNTHAI